ncbi:hypothetical protein FQ330_00480 [Agrococcus sediminis]|uniref:Uncharacterized protein n=1 Tax=Agrococcus sediminis TaxID=2599924 RepID=A0A5M8QRL5_9MICO|nr:hypothetical protein [Agrococcus sediminis]KAA6436822.1 hypothetical protein FQ330_00480 [Agrococcus sediminis]
MSPDQAAIARYLDDPAQPDADVLYWAPSDYQTPYGSGYLDAYDLEILRKDALAVVTGPDAARLDRAFFGDYRDDVGERAAGRVLAVDQHATVSGDPRYVVSRFLALIPFFRAQFLPWPLSDRARSALRAMRDSEQPSRKLRRVRRSLVGTDPRSTAVRYWCAGAEQLLRDGGPETRPMVDEDCRSIAACLLASGEIWASDVWGGSIARSLQDEKTASDGL